ncbi:MAG: N-acetylglucosaminyl-diphospho-decaprenol L-rhamnosyltransferase [Actinomycetota bacterium]|nr:N-acetylglucosaminyl-diphospho-decaprenol L-rhamnosyltransferase [Actinomycetota bacterium]
MLARCVASLLADTSAGPMELVVVDNRSRDGSIAELVAAHPDVHVVRAPGNVGYARAANLGTAATKAPIVAVMNPDTVVHLGTADALVSRLEREPRLAACGPRLQNPDGSDYPSARTLPSIPVAIGHGLLGLWWPKNRFTSRYRQLDADPGVPRLVDWVSGAAIWLRRRALDNVGGWDERYFMYLEDTDLCWRLRNSGWEVAYEPAGVVVHVQGASASRRPYRMLLEHHRSAWRFSRARFTGARAVLLPFAAVYFSGRAVMAMSDHAWRASRSRPSRRRVGG